MRPLTLCLALSLILTACYPVSALPGTPPTPIAIPTDTPPPTATAPPPTPVTTVAYVSTGAADPAMLDAIQRAALEFGWNFQAAPEGSAESVQAFAQAGAQVVVAAGAELEAAALSSARDFPDAYFVVVNQNAAPASLPANALVLGGPDARLDQLGFMAGAAAGFITETRTVAVIADPSSVAGLNYRNGFVHGVRYTCPLCRVLTADVTNPDEAAEARALVAEYRARRADTFFAAAGEAALAAITQAEAWAIGLGGDVYETRFGGGTEPGAEWVLTSVYFDASAAVYSALTAFHARRPLSGRQPFSAAAGAIVFAPLHDPDGRLSELDRADLAAALARLADGSLETGIDLVTGAER